MWCILVKWKNDPPGPIKLYGTFNEERSARTWARNQKFATDEARTWTPIPLEIIAVPLSQMLGI